MEDLNSATKKVFAPGVYEISNEEYHASAGFSRSAIMEFKRSPKHFWHKYVNPNYVKPEQTAAMEFGTALHTALLEPQEFWNRAAVKPEDKITIGKLPLLRDVGREAYEAAKKLQDEKRIAKEAAEVAFLAESEGKIILSVDDKKRLDDMCESIYQDVYAKELLLGAKYEKSIYWIDRETQILCKCRPDIWHNNFIVDYKTAKNASERAFFYQMMEEGYYMQFAMMHLALKNVLNIDMRDFIFLVQEKEEPYLPAVYQLSEQRLEDGIAEFHGLLRQMKICMENNEFPGYEPRLI